MKLKLKNIDIRELSEAYNKVLGFFFSFPNRVIGLTDLSEEVSISKTNAKIVIEDMNKEGFLMKEEVGKAWRISSAKSHPFLITRKMPEHLRMIYESEVVEVIRERIPQAKSIILFGSYRWGVDNEQSDIDIAVEVLSDKEPRIEPLGKIDMGYRKNVNINLFVFSRNKVDLNVFTNIANGIVLDGFLEVHP